MPKENPVEVKLTFPESLATLLTQIRTVVFRLDKKQMVEALRKTRREPSQIPINRNAVTKLENRTRVPSFEHLENYSRLLGLPSSALSFVSRYQRTSLDEAEKVAQAMLNVVMDAKREGRNRLDCRDLLKLAHDIKLEVSERPELPLVNANSRLEAELERMHREGVPKSEDLPLFKKNGD